MENANIIEMINEFFDGELEIANEAYLFKILSENAEAREYFRNFNLLKNINQERDFMLSNAEIDKKIFSAANQTKSDQYSKISRMKFFIKISSVAASIFLFLSVYYYSLNRTAEENLDFAFTQISQQYQKIDKLDELVKVQNSSEVIKIDLKLDENEKAKYQL